MRVFLAGATGAIGRQLTPRLVAAGHDVHGLTQTPGKRGMIEAMGARSVVADALNPDQLAMAIARVRPDVIIHQLTAMASVDTRHMRRDFAATNRLRTLGSDYLLAAGRMAGVKRFIAQSHILTYARLGTLRREEDPIDIDPPPQMKDTLAALAHLEAAVLGAGWTAGIVLRYGWFYGPGTALSPGGEMLEQIRRRRLPLVGEGSGVWSFVHVGDAAAATVAAIEHGARGIYNIVDDDPAPVADWLPTVARQLAAKPPLRAPKGLARIFAGRAGVTMMTDLSGASNAKAKWDLNWRPDHPSWRTHLASG